VKYNNRVLLNILFIFLMATGLSNTSCAQPLNKKSKFTLQDTLRGSIGPGRDWWNVVTYNIHVRPDYNSKTIRGWSEIEFNITSPGKNKLMQIDLQQPMIIESITLDNKPIKEFKREGNVYWISFGEMEFVKAQKNGSPLKDHRIKLNFSGKPREATNPPWDGGWIWKRDAKGNPWMSVACQGLGASVWYPCKDHQSDEPEYGAILDIIVPDTLAGVGNGKLMKINKQGDGTTSYAWIVKNPINNYNIIPYIGKYVSWKDSYQGEKGKLDLEYWVLDYNLEKSKKQFGKDVKPMLKCFENWFGHYPFYEDGFKLVESPHLGMEHQSGIAYGNGYVNGYRGMDLSGSGWGKDWDYIIVHESGHEWFGNNITTNDIADMWIHEGFTDYSETLFVECQYGKKAGDEYTRGLRKNIANDIPIIGSYGVNQEGSGDMYYKGNNLIHTIRQVINNDSLFREILRGLNKDFYHKTVDSRDVETYFNKKSGKDLSKIFDQYLKTTKIPVLEYELTERKDNPGSFYFKYRWNNVVDGFEMPVRILINDVPYWFTPGKNFQVGTVSGKIPDAIEVDKNFYVNVNKL
jgi:aminopeptidase N